MNTYIQPKNINGVDFRFSLKHSSFAPTGFALLCMGQSVTEEGMPFTETFTSLINKTYREGEGLVMKVTPNTRLPRGASWLLSSRNGTQILVLAE